MQNSILKQLHVPAALVLIATGTPPAMAESGRYTMSPAQGGGFVRLDTQTGQMSLCQRAADKWACEPMADHSRALNAEVDKLRAENHRLKDDIRKLEDMALDGKRPGSGERKLELPTEQDVDRAMTYLQRIFKKFQEKLKEFEAENKTPPNGSKQL